MKRIRKNEARKRYNEGKEIIILPCKANPKSAWFTGFTMVNDPAEKEPVRDFDSYVNEFEYFNCCNELGYYAAYYIGEEDDL